MSFTEQKYTPPAGYTGMDAITGTATLGTMHY